MAKRKQTPLTAISGSPDCSLVTMSPELQKKRFLIKLTQSSRDKKIPRTLWNPAVRYHLHISGYWPLSWARRIQSASQHIYLLILCYNLWLHRPMVVSSTEVYRLEFMLVSSSPRVSRVLHLFEHYNTWHSNCDPRALSTVPQAHFLYNERGKYSFDYLKRHILFFVLPLCRICRAFIVGVNHR